MKSHRVLFLPRANLRHVGSQIPRSNLQPYQDNRCNASNMTSFLTSPDSSPVANCWNLLAVGCRRQTDVGFASCERTIHRFLKTSAVISCLPTMKRFNGAPLSRLHIEARKSTIARKRIYLRLVPIKGETSQASLRFEFPLGLQHLKIRYSYTTASAKMFITTGSLSWFRNRNSYTYHPLTTEAIV